MKRYHIAAAIVLVISIFVNAWFITKEIRYSNQSEENYIIAWKTLLLCEELVSQIQNKPTEEVSAKLASILLHLTHAKQFLAENERGLKKNQDIKSIISILWELEHDVTIMVGEDPNTSDFSKKLLYLKNEIQKMKVLFQNAEVIDKEKL